MNILLTSVGRRTYLVEYFKKENCCVHVMNSEETSAFWAADFCTVCPLIYDPSYVPFVLEYCRIHHIELVIPLFDIDVPVLAARRADFETLGVTLVTADYKEAVICNDKWKSYEFLKQNQLRTPASFLKLEDVYKALEQGEITWPLIIKPRWGMGSLSVFEAEDREELEVFYKKSLKGIHDSYLRFEADQDPDRPVLFQEKLLGQEYGLDVINDLSGRYQNTIVKKKYAMRSGETDCAETVEIPELISLGRTLGRLLHHRGNLDVDVFWTEGEPYVLEMNARFGGGYPFSHLAGVNLPQALTAWKEGVNPDSGILKGKPGVRSYKSLAMVRLDVKPDRPVEKM